MVRTEKRKYHYIYKITCNVTKRYYIGMHSTDNLNDGYFGSGKRLWFSINYHGKENHTKEILEFLETRQLLKKREKEIVSKELICDDLCMNLKEGGDGGFVSEIHQKKCSKAGKEAFNLKLKNDNEFRNKFKKILLVNREIGIKNGKIKIPNWEGKTHSEESKELISKSKKNTGVGEANSQFGTCWITKDGSNKKIKKEDLEIYLNEGWVKGRK